MKKQNFLKVFILSAAMVAGLLLPTSMSAQRSDGFFRGGETEIYENRESFVINGNDSEGGLSNYGIGEVAPVGSGLLVLSAAAAAYALARRKRSRKAVALLLACVMLLGFTQCKKKVVETAAPNNAPTVNITLDVRGGSKVDVDPYYNGTYAKVDYEAGDVVYAVYKGELLTTMTYNSTTEKFEGTLPSPAPEPDYSTPLWFYFIGGNGFTAVEGSSNVYSVDISDQTEHYPVISCEHSTTPYEGVGEYTAKLQNKCSIVKFNDNAPADKVLCITGLNNKVTVDFSDGTFTYEKINNGIIRMPSTNVQESGRNIRWAICLPQNDVTTAGDAGSVYTRGRSHKGARPAFAAAIGENQFLDGREGRDGNYALDVPVNDVPAGVIDFAYSVDSDKQVYFSKGNLQFTRESTLDDWSTGEWSFMEHQYDIVETGDVSENYAAETAVSLFGWGCTGYQDDRTYIANPTYAVNLYHPYNTITTGSSFVGNPNVYYGPVVDGNGDGWIANEDVDDTYGISVTHNSDWGYCIGGADSKWFTMSVNEWVYLIVNRRNANNEKLIGLATINVGAVSVTGLLFLPDNSEVIINRDYSDYTDNVYDLKQWLCMEDLGAIFIVRAYHRRGTTMYVDENQSYYWTRDLSDEYDELDKDVYFANAIEILEDGSYYDWNGAVPSVANRWFGCSVRLVYDITSSDK